MPKATDNSVKLSYPPGCKEINEELGTDEIVKRLRLLARTFQEMSQEEDSDYKQVALYLVSEFFLEHESTDVRLLVACCVADIFRIYAPEAPYKDPEQLKEIFLFLTNELKGLQDPNGPSFKRYFYLLENLAWVKSFNICLELDDNQQIFCRLFTILFSTINDRHAAKVSLFMLDLMTPLISEADGVSQPLLEIILGQILEPHKSQNKPAYNLARDLIKRTVSSLEPSLQQYFNSMFLTSEQNESANVSSRLYDVILELNELAPALLLTVLPQIEFKLKSSEELERKSVTKLLAKMLAHPSSELAVENKNLWLCFLGRFNDVSAEIRRLCVKEAPDVLVNHSDLASDIIEHLKQRQHDQEESVRLEVVLATLSIARKNLSSLSEELIECVKERTLDKKVKVRREALSCLGQLYKLLTEKKDPTSVEKQQICAIRNKILHAYYHPSIEDRVLVERLINNIVISYMLDSQERMKRLYVVYGNIDNAALRALQEIFKTQIKIQNLVRSLINEKPPSDEQEQLIRMCLLQLSKLLPENFALKPSEVLQKFNLMMKKDPKLKANVLRVVTPGCPCKKAEELTRDILKRVSASPLPEKLTQQQNHAIVSIVKTLMERCAPLMIDGEAVKYLLKFVNESIQGIGDLLNEVPSSVENGLKLVQNLSRTYTVAFQTEDTLEILLDFAKNQDELISGVAFQVFGIVGEKLETEFSDIYTELIPLAQKLAQYGTPKQAKYAIKCICQLCPVNKDTLLQPVFDNVQKNLEASSTYFLTAIVALGHIAEACPGRFGIPTKSIVSKFLVREVLMQEKTPARKSNESWCADHLVSDETKAKIQALKASVRWLLGYKNDVNLNAGPVLRMLHMMLLNEGDLMNKGKICKAEMSRLRLQAGCCVLKLSQEPLYTDLVSLPLFQTMALLINDSCFQVREKFTLKLHQGLLAMRLPLQYMSIFAHAANEVVKERKQQVKQYLISNINKRREFLKQNTQALTKQTAIMPDYVMPYTIHLLAHEPDLKNWKDIETLQRIEKCLWFMIEPLATKTDQYNYSFYQQMLESIKQTKDAQNPDDKEANEKLYAVCDLTLGVILSKLHNNVLKALPVPAVPVLPKKLFVEASLSKPNATIYLPSELASLITKNKDKVGLKEGIKKIINGATTDSESEVDEADEKSPSISDMSSSGESHRVKKSAKAAKAEDKTKKKTATNNKKQKAAVKKNVKTSPAKKITAESKQRSPSEERPIPSRSSANSKSTATPNKKVAKSPKQQSSSEDQSLPAHKTDTKSTVPNKKISASPRRPLLKEINDSQESDQKSKPLTKKNGTTQEADQKSKPVLPATRKNAKVMGPEKPSPAKRKRFPSDDRPASSRTAASSKSAMPNKKGTSVKRSLSNEMNESQDSDQKSKAATTRRSGTKITTPTKKSAPAERLSVDQPLSTPTRSKANSSDSATPNRKIISPRRYSPSGDQPLTSSRTPVTSKISVPNKKVASPRLSLSSEINQLPEKQKSKPSLPNTRRSTKTLVVETSAERQPSSCDERTVPSRAATSSKSETPNKKTASLKRSKSTEVNGSQDSNKKSASPAKRLKVTQEKDEEKELVVKRKPMLRRR